MENLQDVHIHGLWKERTETLDEHVAQIVDTFRLCAQLSDHWQTWYRNYQTEEEWRQPPIVLNENATRIRAELVGGMIKDENGQVEETLGFAMGAFAGPQRGTRNECTLFRVSCGKRGLYAGPNTLSFKLPDKRKTTSKLYDPDFLAHVVKGLAQIWRPDWLVVRDLLSEVMKPPWTHGPVLGWVNFLPPDTAKVRSLSTGWRWAEGNEGIVFVFDDGIPVETNASHVRAVSQMVEHIEWAER